MGRTQRHEVSRRYQKGCFPRNDKAPQACDLHRRGARCVSGGGLEPPRPLRALAPQASASAIPPPGPSTARVLLGARATRGNDSTHASRFSNPPTRVNRMTDNLTPQAEVARICRDLIRIDSSNYGDGSGPGERACAEYVMGELAEVGLAPLYVESAPGRANVIVRIEGSDRSRPGLAVHGHLDVVSANSADWQVDPFAAEVRDGCIWGRGAIDMKNMDAMILANVRHLARSGVKPPRD